MSGFHGVVYTRRWVVDLILDIAGYSGPSILERRLLEPSCGDGSFLCAVASRLASEASSAGVLEPDRLSGLVVACDLDPASVEASQSAVASVLRDAGMEAGDAGAVARSWVRCDDYLLADFGSFDFVVGNPPYLRATEIDPQARASYTAVCETMTRGCDLFVGFIEKGVRDLAPGGSLTYICADRWLQNQYGRTLRRWLVDSGYSVDVLVRMYGVDAFEAEVDAYPSITRIVKDVCDIRYADCSADFSADDAIQLRDALACGSWPVDGRRFRSGWIRRPLDGSVVPLASPSVVSLVERLSAEFPLLEDAGVRLGIGLATGRDKVFITDDPDAVEPERLLPAFSMRDHRRHTGKKRWLVNPWNRDNTLIDLEDWPRTKAYFEAHRDDLSKRHVARASGDYYRTIDKPNWSLYGREMLLWPDLAAHADPVWSDGSRYPCHNCYWMLADDWDLKALAGLLMSDVAESFVDALGVKMRGGTLRFQAQYLRLIHVPLPQDIPSSTMGRLADAFASGDRGAANAAAREAYRLEG